MNHVQLERKNDKEKVVFSRSFYVASTWNELSRKQLLLVAPLLHGATDVWVLRLALLKIVLGIRNRLFLALTPEQHVLALKPLTDWLLEATTLTEQLLPTIRLGWRGRFRKLYGPASNFENLRAAEFDMAEKVCRDFQESKDPSALDGLLAILYRPRAKDYNPNSPDTSGDPRELYNEHLLPKRSALVEHLPLAVKLSVYFWYMGCRHALTARYDTVFTSTNETEAKSSSWSKVWHSLAGPTFGTLSQVEAQPIERLLTEMEIKTEQHKEMLERNKAQ